uniref:protein-tyrosine-phosphatase n=1 Tax=Chlorobium chlorochromatii (strain CaD3) TaxID=340177 RepID=Q3ASV2_CHLCH
MQSVVKQQNITDFHCHILPSVDDGSPNIASSVEMARLLVQAGYKQVYCTSHLIKGMYEVTNSELLHTRDMLQQELNKQDIALQLLFGREYYLDEFLLDFLTEPLLFEGTNLLMVEIPNNTSADVVKNTLFAIARRGYTPMIAHPERCQLLEITTYEQKSTKGWKKWFMGGKEDSTMPEHTNSLLRYLQQLGCMFQGNLGSFKGLYGHRVKANARAFEQYGLYTHFGTDGHSPDMLRSLF